MSAIERLTAHAFHAAPPGSDDRTEMVVALDMAIAVLEVAERAEPPTPLDRLVASARSGGTVILARYGESRPPHMPDWEAVTEPDESGLVVASGSTPEAAVEAALAKIAAECSTCGGDGWVLGVDADPLPSGEPGEPQQVQVACPDCGGGR